MPQGVSKQKQQPKQKKNKKAIAPMPKRVYKKKKDPIKAALAKKVDAIVFEKAMKDPFQGGTRFIKPNEDNTKAAKISTKSLLKNPTQKIK